MDLRLRLRHPSLPGQNRERFGRCEVQGLEVSLNEVICSLESLEVSLDDAICELQGLEVSRIDVLYRFREPIGLENRCAVLILEICR